MSDPLGRYYTKSIWPQFLINNFQNIKEPKAILDLGIGEGALSYAAYQRWSNAKFYAFEVDKKVIGHISAKMPFVNIVQANTLTRKFCQGKQLSIGTIDLAICNPPYYKIKNKIDYSNLFITAKLDACRNLKYLTADLIFLANNLIFLRKGGVLGIIVPDTLITNYDFMEFRKSLLKNYRVEKIVQLPDKIFKGTEARTYILVIRKEKPKESFVSLYSANGLGVCSKPIKITVEKLFERMDFHFYAKAKKITDDFVPLSECVEFVKRGSYSYKICRNLDVSYCHTSNLQSQDLHFCDNTYFGLKGLIAEEGDILFSRVGKRCIGKSSIIRCGRILISDCVYVIRPKSNLGDKILKSFKSGEGYDWINRFSHGVCSQVISKRDILNFPVKL